jgi:serine/threonine protein kinase
MLAPQTVLKDRYLIKSKIGQGGFGITYLAVDQNLEIEVCIKELFISLSKTSNVGFFK